MLFCLSIDKKTVVGPRGKAAFSGQAPEKTPPAMRLQRKRWALKYGPRPSRRNGTATMRKKAFLATVTNWEDVLSFPVSSRYIRDRNVLAWNMPPAFGTIVENLLVVSSFAGSGLKIQEHRFCKRRPNLPRPRQPGEPPLLQAHRPVSHHCLLSILISVQFII